LRRLGVERIDLYQIHRPDLLAHPPEVAQALERLRSAGKIHSAGVSNHTAAQVDALRAHLPFDLATVQNEFSPLVIEPLSDGTLDQAMQRGIAMLAWSPLAQGRLAVSAGEAFVEPRVAAVIHAHAAARTVVAHGPQGRSAGALVVAVLLPPHTRGWAGRGPATRPDEWGRKLGTPGAFERGDSP